MESPLFVEHIHLIAGQGGVDRYVEQVAVMEVPDFHLGYYEPGLFLLSTLYYCKDDKELMLAAFRVMADKGASGMLLKLDRFLREVPPELIQLANERSVPLFVTGRAIKFRNVIFSIVSEIYNARLGGAEKPRFGEYSQNSCCLNDKSIDNILTSVLDNLGFSCCCVMPSGEVTAEILKENHPSFKITEFLSECIGQVQRTSKDELLPFYTVADNMLLPCVADDRILGFLVVNSTISLNYEDRNYLDKCVLHLTFALFKRYQEAKERNQAASLLMENLLYRPDITRQDVKERLQSMGYQAADDFCIISLQIQAQNEKKNILIKNAIAGYVDRNLHGSLIHALHDGVVIVVSFTHSGKNAREATVKEAAAKIADVVSLMSDVDIGVSDISSDYTSFAQFYQDTRNVIHLGHLFHSGQKAYFYSEFMEHRALNHILGTEEHKLIEKNILSPLRQYDAQYNSNLLGSLGVCLNSDSLSKAASALQIHLSTLRYRLKKIDNICGLDYFSGKNRYILRIAYMLSILN
jgi:sugar diacid utilization regulator